MKYPKLESIIDAMTIIILVLSTHIAYSVVGYLAIIILFIEAWIMCGLHWLLQGKPKNFGASYGT